MSLIAYEFKLGSIWVPEDQYTVLLGQTKNPDDWDILWLKLVARCWFSDVGICPICGDYTELLMHIHVHGDMETEIWEREWALEELEAAGEARPLGKKICNCGVVGAVHDCQIPERIVCVVCMQQVRFKYLAFHITECLTETGPGNCYLCGMQASLPHTECAIIHYNYVRLLYREIAGEFAELQTPLCLKCNKKVREENWAGHFIECVGVVPIELDKNGLRLVIKKRNEVPDYRCYCRFGGSEREMIDHMRVVHAKNWEMAVSWAYDVYPDLAGKLLESGPRIESRIELLELGPRIGSRIELLESGPRIGSRIELLESGPEVDRIELLELGPRIEHDELEPID